MPGFDSVPANTDRRRCRMRLRNRCQKPMGLSRVIRIAGCSLLLAFIVTLFHLDASFETGIRKSLLGVEAFGIPPGSLSKSRAGNCLPSREIPKQINRSNHQSHRAAEVPFIPHRAFTTLAAESQSETENEPSISSASGVTYRIRDCQYRELSVVAGLIVESFYDKKKVNLVARKLYQLAETNRLQQNFPYPESRRDHRMLVVEANAPEAEEPEVVGFCDVDTRPCATKVKLPRPYLSDLAIDPGHRRRGLARKLVEASEDFVRNDAGTKPPPFGELWIRVASDNEAALGLYRNKLGYSPADWSTGEETPGKEAPEVWTLRKDFDN